MIGAAVPQYICFFGSLLYRCQYCLACDGADCDAACELLKRAAHQFGVEVIRSCFDNMLLLHVMCFSEVLSVPVTVVIGSPRETERRSLI